MKRESSPAPAGSSHHILAAWPTAGNINDKELKITSVLQSNLNVSFDSDHYLNTLTLSQCLYLCSLNPNTSKPKNTLQTDRRSQSRNRYGWQLCCLMWSLRYQFLTTLLQYLKERDDHNDTEDQYTQRFQPPSPNREFPLQLRDMPLNQLMSCKHYRRA